MAINDGHGTSALPDRGFTLWIVSVVMVTVAGLFVIARLAARLTKNKFGYDDYTIVAALVSSGEIYDSKKVGDGVADYYQHIGCLCRSINNREHGYVYIFLYPSQLHSLTIIMQLSSMATADTLRVSPTMKLS